MGATHLNAYSKISGVEIVAVCSNNPRALSGDLSQVGGNLNRTQKVSFLLAEQNTMVALRFADFGYILENGRVVMDGDCASLRENEDVKEFYLGVGGSDRKSFRETKHYRRRKRWLA